MLPLGHEYVTCKRRTTLSGPPKSTTIILVVQLHPRRGSHRSTKEEGSAIFIGEGERGWKGILECNDLSEQIFFFNPRERDDIAFWQRCAIVHLEKDLLWHTDVEIQRRIYHSIPSVGTKISLPITAETCHEWLMHAHLYGWVDDITHCKQIPANDAKFFCFLCIFYIHVRFSTARALECSLRTFVIFDPGCLDRESIADSAGALAWLAWVEFTTSSEANSSSWRYISKAVVFLR